MKSYQKFLLMIASIICVNAAADIIIIPMKTTAGKVDVGVITATETKYGVLFTPKLHDLPPGVHGLHIHQNPSCDMQGEGAGGHLDPKKTGKHLGPYSDQGHLGDLPVLTVDEKGTATLPILAPRLTLAELKEHALMIHQGADNYSDSPEALGGGGPRIACGIIK